MEVFRKCHPAQLEFDEYKGLVYVWNKYYIVCGLEVIVDVWDKVLVRKFSIIQVLLVTTRWPVLKVCFRAVLSAPPFMTKAI